MASSLILFLLPAVLACFLLRRHFRLVYYRTEKVVTDILGFGHADSASTNTPPKQRCFGISDIPNTWGKDQLVQALKAEQPGLDEESVQRCLQGVTLRKENSLRAMLKWDNDAETY
jgi:hypothetical protein